MDLVNPILKIAGKLYALCGRVKANKKCCQRLADRVQALADIVRSVEEPEAVRSSLEELKYTLEAVHKVVKKYTSANCLIRCARAYNLDEKFEMLNKRLDDTSQQLSLALQIEQREKLASVFAEARRREEDRVDMEKDHKELKMMAEKMDAMKERVDLVEEGVDMLRHQLPVKTPSLQLLDIRESKLEELEFEGPKKPILTSSTHELYKGHTANTTSSPAMDIVDPILSIAEKLYALCGEVKANKKRCQRLADRVKALEEVVRAVRVKGLGKEPEAVRRGLQELMCTLEAAQEVVKKYTSAHFLTRIAQADDLDEEFERLNNRLNDAFQLLSLALKSDRDRIIAALDTLTQKQLLGFKHKLSELKIIGFGLIENEVPVQIAHRLVSRFTEACAIAHTAQVLRAIDLHEEADNLEEGENYCKGANVTTGVGAASLIAAGEIDGSTTSCSSNPTEELPVKTPSLQLLDIRESKLEELEFEEPKKPILTSSTHELHKGHTANTTSSPAMDIVDPILSIAEKLYVLCGEVKANKKRCQRLADRVKALEEIVRSVRVKGLGKEPEAVRCGLEELKCILEAAQEVVKKYTSAHFLTRIAQADDLDEEFERLNNRLNDAFQLLSLALKSDRDCIIATLDNLTQKQLLEFKHKLSELKIIGFGLIENEVPVQIARRLVSKFTEVRAIAHTAQVLRAIDLHDEADNLQKGEND